MEKGESPNALPNSNNNAAQEATKKGRKIIIKLGIQCIM